eukprot:GGOE01014420.1.p1 GENE.GGOE01014420.1~~GGOE01014420.1.p1  ORF type:complete len:938 (-),score=354.46 GGOE01014420.1:309-2801(-)
MSEEEKALAKESKLLWDLKEKLKANLEPKEYKEVLEECNQPATGKVFGGVERNLNRLADGMLFGWLPKCPTCKEGDLIFSHGRYKCTGYISEYAECDYESTDVKRTAFKCPAGWKDNAFLGKFKFKAQSKVMANIVGDEMEVDEAPASPKAKQGTPASAATASSPSGEGKPKREESPPKPPEKPFEGLTVTAVGKLKKTLAELEKVVKEHGGSFAKTVTKNVDILVTNELEVETMSSKVKQADKLKITMVKEEWMWKSIELGRKLDKLECKDFYLKNAPTLSDKEKTEMEREARKRKAAELDAEAEKRKAELETQPTEENPQEGPKRKKLKVKAGCRVAVEPESGLEDEAHVLDVKADELYNVVLNFADVVRNKNTYYMMQLLESDKQPRKYWVFRKWGRMGTELGDYKRTDYDSLQAAKKEFMKTYLDKTGNKWDDRNAFQKKSGKFMQIDVDYSQPEGGSSSAAGPYKGPLTKPVQDLISLICDTRMMNSCLMELEIDTKKMPLGKLSKKTIKEGYSALTAIASLLNQKPEPSNKKTLLASETNKFFTLIPHEFGGKPPPIIDNEDLLKAKIALMDTLTELEVATSLLGTEGGKEGEHPIDTNYQKLKCPLEPVDKESDEFKLIAKYVKNTHGSTHTTYTLEVEDLFRMAREGEEELFKPNKGDANRMLLWHGSRLTNWVGIISQGLRIAPPEAPATGYMFGKGVYFADMVTKSSNYCFTSSDNTTGIMALSEVALGKPYKLTGAKYMDKPPAGFQSTMGCGRQHPDPAGNKTLPDGVMVPCGKATSAGLASTTLQYNEFIVYNVAQIQMRYLLRMKFHYKAKAGTFF